MPSKLFDRIAILLKADAHGVVESLEERSLLLKQYVREAEIELDRKRARLEAVRDEEKRLRDALAHREDEIRSLDEDIALALAGGKDDLARFAIRRLLPRRSEVKALRTELEDRVADGHSLAERVDVQQTQLENLRIRVRAELAREPDVAGAPAWLSEPVVADEEVELELLRRRRQEGAP
ncbi:MAG TPA: PspA/IM30 family protein [Candidatus Binatia bacterium]|nr:PspA/IM30 family protein [Candidatus Binatia bacterium]